MAGGVDMNEFQAKLRSIQFSGKKNAKANWDKDMDSYARMRKDGLQPPQIDGCAELEKKASSKFEVELGRALTPEQMKEARQGIRRAEDIQMGLA